MSTFACFIGDRAATLAYEAVRFPTTADSAVAWLRRAMAWATANDNQQLFSALHCHYAYMAILVRCDEDADGAWLPKSQFKYEGERGDCGVEIEIPEFLADEKGFFDGMGKPAPDIPSCRITD